MNKRSTAVLPQTQEILNQLGEQIRLARLRRHLSAELVAERAGISRMTLSNIEKKGSPSVAKPEVLTMKKAISLLLVLILCLSLVACGGQSQNIESNANIDNNHTDNNNTNKTEDEALVLFDEEYKYPFVNQARFHELVEEVELTTENWLDYLEVCSYTVEKVETDTFGDIVSSTTSTAYVLGAKNNRYYHLRRFAIELKDKSTEELKIYESTSTGGQVIVTEDFSLDQYECTRIKGTLYLIDVPEEAIQEAKGAGRYFTVRYSDIGYGPPIDCFICGTDGYEIGQMLDFVLY